MADDVEFGHVVGLTLGETVGTELTADAAVDATTLEVDYAGDFEDAGSLVLNGEVLAYTSIAYGEGEADPDVITLAAPLATAAETDARVGLMSGGEAVTEWSLQVSLGDGHPVDIPIPFEQRAMWSSVDVSTPVPVVVSADLSRLAEVPGRTPVIDGAAIDTSTLPAIPGGQTISDDAPVEVDGYPEDYGWWQVVDGEALGFWRLVGGVWTPQTFSLDEGLFASNAFIEHLTGKTLTGATVQTRSTVDRGVKLGRVEGATNYEEAFIVFNESGVPFIKAVPAEELAVIAGEVKATTTTVIDGASLGGVTEITRGPVNADNPTGSPGALRLTAGTTAPKSAPTVTTGYDTVQFTDDGNWGDRRGWATDGTYWYTARSTSAGYRVEKWDATGSLVSSVNEATAPAIVFGVAIDSTGGHLYVFEMEEPPGLFFPFYFVRRHSTTTLARTAYATWIHNDGSRDPTIGYDPTASQILIAHSRASNGDAVRVRRYTWPSTSGADLVAGASVDSDFALNADLAGVTYGTHDFGANRYVFASRAVSAGGFRVVDTTGAAVNAENWQSGMPEKVGFTYTGGAFVSMDVNGLMRTYTGQDKTVAIGDGDLTKWVSNTLANAIYETNQSPRAKITIPKRTKLNVSTSAINTAGTNAPDRVKIYVGKGATDPGRAAMWQQTDPGVGVITTAYASIATSGTNPPASNNFPSGHVQRFELADGTVVVDGQGDGSPWTSWTPTWTGASSNPAIGNGTLVGRYHRLGKRITFYIEMVAGSTTTFGSGLWSFDLPVAEVARRWSAVGTAYDTSGNDEYRVTGIRTASDTLNIRCDPSTAGGAMRGVATGTPFTWATGDILHISGTYEAA